MRGGHFINSKQPVDDSLGSVIPPDGGREAAHRSPILPAAHGSPEGCSAPPSRACPGPRAGASAPAASRQRSRPPPARPAARGPSPRCAPSPRGSPPSCRDQTGRSASRRSLLRCWCLEERGRTRTGWHRQQGPRLHGAGLVRREAAKYEPRMFSIMITIPNTR